MKNQFVFGIHNVKIDQKKSLIEFFEKVVPVLAQEKIFVSKQIFQECWRACEETLGAPKISASPTAAFYSFEIASTINANFCVWLNQNPRVQIQLIELKTPKIYYRAPKNCLAKKFYFQHEPESEKQM